MKSKKLKWLFVLALVVLALSLMMAPLVCALVVTIDGIDTPALEWGATVPSISDPAEGFNPAFDIVQAWGACDQGVQRAYFRIDTAAPPNLSSAASSFSIYIDLDNNPGTGCDANPARHGYEFQIVAIGHVGTQVSTCGAPPPTNWVPTAFYSYGGPQVGHMEVDFVEVGVNLSALPGVTCPPPGSYPSWTWFVAAQDGDPAPDDEAPDSGNRTLIELASFIASAQAGGMRVEWQTASEIDNAGFNLYRSDGGEYARLNAALIPAQGGPTVGASYTYDDVDVVPGTTYYYRLEDVDLNGQATLHGPVIVEVGEMPTAIEVRAFGASRAAAWLPTFVLVFGAMGLAWTWRRKRR